MKLIIIDGPNGVGKTTIMKLLECENKVFTMGWTEPGQKLREICRGKGDSNLTSNLAIVHAIVADRLETLHRLHQKEKSVGHELVYVTDRWMVSCLAYQLYMNEHDSLESELIKNILKNSLTDFEKLSISSKVFHIKCNPELVVDRIIKERKDNPEHGYDKFIKLEHEYQEKLVKAYDNAFNDFCNMVNKGCQVVELYNNDYSDLDNCVSTIQKEIDTVNDFVMI